MNAAEVNDLRKKFEKVVVDLGTGDGRFVYKKALAEPTTLFIGIEPAHKQVEEFARKVARQKLENVLFVVGSFELLPEELSGVADKLFIILPWGTLLKAIAEPNEADISTIKYLLKPKAEVEFIFGFDAQLEPSQTNRLQLGEINEKNTVQVFEENGFTLVESTQLLRTKLSELESTWGKRISSTMNRKIFRLVFALN